MLTALCGFCLAACPAGPPPARAATPVFGPGEQLLYDIRYFGVTGAKASVTVGAPLTRDGQESWPIVMVARTEPVLAFFPVRDQFVTFWDPLAGLSHGTEMSADENGHRHRERSRIDDEACRATLLRQREGARSENGYDVPRGTVDIGAAAFILRDQALAVGKSFQLPIFTGKRVFTLEARVEGVQTLHTALGDRQAFRVNIQTAFAGNFQTKRDIVAYFTTDTSHVMLRLEADFFLGTLVADLTGYQPGKTADER